MFIVPYKAENPFIPDWNYCVPLDKACLAYYLTPDIVIKFSDIYTPEHGAMLDFEELFKSHPDLDIDALRSKLKDHSKYGRVRVKNLFAGKRETLFFDIDEIDMLKGIFTDDNFTATVEVLLCGEVIDINTLEPKIKKLVINALEVYDVVGIVSPNKLCEYENRRRAKIIKRKEGFKMSKSDALKKVGFGICLLGVSAVSGLIGANLVNDVYKSLTGRESDVILVEDEGDTHDFE